MLSTDAQTHTRGKVSGSHHRTRRTEGKATVAVQQEAGNHPHPSKVTSHGCGRANRLAPSGYIKATVPSTPAVSRSKRHSHPRQVQELPVAWMLYYVEDTCTSLLTTAPFLPARTEITPSSHGQHAENIEDTQQAGGGG